MMWRALCNVDKRVATKEELRYVTTQVVLQVEFAARVDALVAVQIKHQVVEDDEVLTFFNLLVDIFWCESDGFALTLGSWSLNMTHRILIAYT